MTCIFFFPISSIIIPTFLFRIILLPPYPVPSMAPRSLIPCVLLIVFFFQQTPAFSREIQVKDSGHLIRDGGHHHSSHAQPILKLNETEVLQWHAPTPPSYYTIDWEEPQNGDKRYPGLILSHAVFMSLAFFIALPVGEFVSIQFTLALTELLHQVSSSVPLSTQVTVWPLYHSMAFLFLGVLPVDSTRSLRQTCTFCELAGHRSVH